MLHQILYLIADNILAILDTPIIFFIGYKFVFNSRYESYINTLGIHDYNNHNLDYMCLSYLIYTCLNLCTLFEDSI